jgi:hypothetical protein
MCSNRYTNAVGAGEKKKESKRNGPNPEPLGENVERPELSGQLKPHNAP